MSFGFGLGLPHYVAVLGGGGPPATVYFISLTSPSNPAINFYPYSEPYIDASGDINIFGFNRTDSLCIFTEEGLIIKLTSSGSLSSSIKLTSASTGIQATKDSSGNYYIVGNNGVMLTACCMPYVYSSPEVIKLNSSFTKLGGGALDNGGNTYGPVTKPFIDSSGNFWSITDISSGYSANYLQKFNSSYGSPVIYRYTSGGAYVNPAAMALTASNAIIYAGAYYVPNACCNYDAYASIQSIPSATPTAAPTWGIYDSSAAVGYFSAVTVSSSGNIYAALRSYPNPTTTYIVKLNSSGVVQWQYSYVGMQYIQSIAVDSSGNVYGIGMGTASTSFTIVKVVDNGSTASLSFSRELTATTAGGYLGIPKLAVSGTIMYVNAQIGVSPTISPAILTLKLPTDGSLTGSMSVGGVNFTYALGGVTSSTTQSTIPLVSSPSWPLAATAQTAATSLMTATTTTASQAVTTL
jgi:hypothetical protein